MRKSVFLSAFERILEQVMPSERKSAEKGVHAVQGPFDRLGTKITADSHHRYRIFTVVATLLNYRLRNVGQKQLGTI